MCGVHQHSTDLHIWPLQWGHLVALLCCWGKFAGMIWVHLSSERGGSLQINTKLFWVKTFIQWWIISILMGVVSSRMTVPSIHSVKGVTKWFDKYENYVTHTLWSQSPHRNPIAKNHCQGVLKLSVSLSILSSLNRSCVFVLIWTCSVCHSVCRNAVADWKWI